MHVELTSGVDRMKFWQKLDFPHPYGPITLHLYTFRLDCFLDKSILLSLVTERKSRR